MKTHFYYSMKNCGGDASKLRKDLENIVEHYMVCMLHISALLSLHQSRRQMLFP